MERTEQGPRSSISVEAGANGETALRLTGRLDSERSGAIWRRAVESLRGQKPVGVVVQADEVDYCDGSGIALLFDLKLQGRRGGYPVEIRGLRPEFQELLDRFREADFARAAAARPSELNLAEEVGKVTAGLGAGAREQVAFVGELCAALVGTALRPWRLRWRDTFVAAEMAGARATGIILMLGGLFGLILAFSSAMPLQQFGAEVYVSDLVAISLLRVLGPFVTAVILAGRSGSAFAAELGTMKINDEIDALTTMGLDPVDFLVVPRVLAATVVAPLLTILTNVAGLAGAAFVLRSLGYPMVIFTEHVESVVDSGDLLVGLGKAVVFGALVGGVSCLRGLQTKAGASAVGISTTRAVVSSIVLLVIAEGIFSVLLYFMGI